MYNCPYLRQRYCTQTAGVELISMQCCFNMSTTSALALYASKKHELNIEGIPSGKWSHKNPAQEQRCFRRCHQLSCVKMNKNIPKLHIKASHE